MKQPGLLMKVLRFLAFALGGMVMLLGVLAVVAWVIVSTFDGAAFKTQLAQWVREAKHRELKIEGEIALSMWPRIGLSVGKASLSEKDSEAPFVQLDEAQVSLAILPLFKKEFVVDRLHVQGLSATVARNKQGAWNFADLMAAEGRPSTLRFDVSRIEIRNARLGLRDERTGRQIRLSEIDLETGQLGQRSEGGLKLAAKLGASQTDAAITLDGRYRFNLDNGDVALDEVRAGWVGKTGGLDMLDAAFSLARVRFDGKLGKGLIEGAQWQARGQAGGGRFEGLMSAPKIALENGEAKSDAMQLTLKAGQGAHAVDAKFDLQGARTGEAGVSLAKLAVDATARIGSATLRGNLASPLAADFAGPRVELGALAGQIDITDPNKLGKPMRMGLSGSGRLDLAASRADVRANLRLGESSAKLDLSATRLAPLALNFDVNVDQLNIDRYLPPRSSAARTAAPVASSEATVDLSALKELDLNGRIRLGELQVSRIKAREVKLDVRSRDGTLELAPFSANLYQGAVAGSARIDLEKNRYTLRQTLSNVSIGPLLKDALDRDVIEGRGSVVMDLSSEGTHLSAWKRSLSGTARIELRDGALYGVNVARVLRDMKSAAKGQAVVSGRNEKTDFSEMTSSWRIAQGVARNEDLSVRSPYLRGSGSGSIDLVNYRINYLARLGLTGPGGRDAAESRGLTVPVKIEGELDAPSFSFDAAGMVRDAARRPIDEAKGRVQQKVEEKLRGLLLR